MDQPLDSPSRVKFIALSNTIIIVYDYLLRELAGCTCFAAGGACEAALLRLPQLLHGRWLEHALRLRDRVYGISASLAWLLALKRFTYFHHSFSS